MIEIVFSTFSCRRSFTLSGYLMLLADRIQKG
jgi:hypothetical protein